MQLSFIASWMNCDINGWSPEECCRQYPPLRAKHIELISGWTLSGPSNMLKPCVTVTRGKADIKITHMTLSMTLFLGVTRAHHDLVAFVVCLHLVVSCRVAGALYCCAVLKAGYKETSSLPHRPLFSEILHSFMHISGISLVFHQPLYNEVQHDQVLATA